MTFEGLAEREAWVFAYVIRRRCLIVGRHGFCRENPIAVLLSTVSRDAAAEKCRIWTPKPDQSRNARLANSMSPGSGRLPGRGSVALPKAN